MKPAGVAPRPDLLPAPLASLRGVAPAGLRPAPGGWAVSWQVSSACAPWPGSAFSGGRSQAGAQPAERESVYSCAVVGRAGVGNLQSGDRLTVLWFAFQQDIIHAFTVLTWKNARSVSPS